MIRNLSRRSVDRRIDKNILPFLAVVLACVLCVAGQPANVQAEVIPAGVANSTLLLDPVTVPLPSPGSPPQHSVVSPLNFVFNPTGNLANMLSGSLGVPAQQLGQNVQTGFQEAADRWRAIFVDPITIELDINFGPIGDGILGGASSTLVATSYSNVAARMGVDQTSPDDALAVANLQPATVLDFITNDSTGVGVAPRIRDNDGSSNNANIRFTRANAQALGFGVPAGIDGSITFSDFSDFMMPNPTNLSWDFDPSDGIGANQIDFVGTATHEIGHAMGFISGVDVVDKVSDPNGPQGATAQAAQMPAEAPIDLDGEIVVNTLDLFRYTSDSLGQASQPATGGVLDLAFGEPSALDTPFFSIDGGTTNLGTFSTGRFNGDGRQASHWEDLLGLGIMDPTLSTATVATITPLDIRAFDVIGYNLVPEPASIAYLLTGWLAWCAATRRRKATR